MKVGGVIRPPGDKSITHRALILAALADGRSRLRGCLTSLDARSMAGALRLLGVDVGALRQGRPVEVVGRGLRGLSQPTRTIHCGNSGTAARLLLGVLAGCPLSARLTGDRSLRGRPMRRVTEPLARMGARFREENGDGLPVVVAGGPLQPLSYASPTASAQVKSALLLAGLVGGVPVSLSEPARSRDHSERMLRALGVPVTISDRSIRLEPAGALPPLDVSIPGDPSSAAFLVAAALLADRGELRIEGVGINPTRIGFLSILRRMGADVEVRPGEERLGEPVGDLVVRPSRLVGTTVEPDEVPSLIDEVPILAVLAARAAGETVFRGVKELRVKESDRLGSLARNLRNIGVEAWADGDMLRVTGSHRPLAGSIETASDHRIAMAFSVLGRRSEVNVHLSETDSPTVSYPGFFEALESVVS